MNRILPQHFDKRTILLTGLSLSIGWGIRGNFGHEIGAMVPGALAAMAVVLLARREDWHRRIAYFVMFGAIGWSFGGGRSRFGCNDAFNPGRIGNHPRDLRQ